MTPIVAKIVAGIVFRARGGQLSESLVQRLRQALNDDKEVRTKLSYLAKSEHGLSPEVQDWLLGIDRKPASGAVTRKILSAVSEEGFIRAITPAFLLAQETLSVADAPGRVAPAEIQLATLVSTIGKQYGLEVVGKMGDRVEYLPAAYESVDGRPPLDRYVEIVRPMVVRQRSDGTRDVVMKGLIKPL